ncbi:MAG TPA: heat-inducible transcriptional repressor HrcA [Acidimicrobiales bacterium]|jgi:heat-inducible transcriptional repressor
MEPVEERTRAEGPERGQLLDARKAAILEAVVSEYIGTAQPVGSQLIAQSPGIRVSSATVRSEMVALEHEGFLVQPHTSAGRIPTDKGYRFFVDHLADPGVLGPAQRQKVSRFFEQVHGEMEEMLERTSGLLSDLTSYAAVVVGPSHTTASVRSVQLVGLGPRLALLVVVLSDGAVEKRSVDFSVDVPEEDLRAAGAHLHQVANGRELGHVGPFGTTGDPDVDAVVAQAAAAFAALGRDEEGEQVFVGGPSRLAVAFDAVDTVRSVLSILEQQLVVVTLLRDVLDRGLSVAIGAEHGFEALSSCAVVVAPVSIEGHEAGAVGLLGPTRMDYGHALAAAQVVGQRLGERLGATLEAGGPGRSTGARRTGGRTGRRARMRGDERAGT